MTLEVANSTEFEGPGEAVDTIIDRLGPDLVVGTPLGIGKPLALLDEIYERARDDPSLRVHFITALSLAPPRAGSELERRMLDPIAERMEGWEESAWVADMERGEVPGNVRISEFYLTPGAFVDADHAQRWHINSNYTDVVRACIRHGINVIAQSLAMDDSGRLSLASNPDVTLDLLAHLAISDRPSVMVGVIDDRLPFAGGDAVVSREQIDVLIDSRGETPEPFPLIAEPIELTHHAIGLQAAALVPDGGTIQFGIGSLANAVAWALILRHTEPEAYRRALEATGALDRHQRLISETGGIEPFQEGLYGCSEMLSDGLLALYDAGILRRRAYPDEAVQRMVDSGALDPVVSVEALHALRKADLVDSPLTQEDLALLNAIGLIGECRMEDGSVIRLPDGSTVSADLDTEGPAEALVASAPGDRLQGPLIHAAFFLGSSRFYERLRRMGREDGGDLNMTSVAFTNSLDGTPAVKRAQRRRARFVNQVMKIGTDGSLSAHTLASGRTLSGVGGSFDFVELSRHLPEGRSITLLTSTHTSGGRTESNVVAKVPYVTIPGQHRDLVVTEYGIADLRDQAAGAVFEELVGVADARFQDELIRHGVETGRLPEGFQPPEEARGNHAEMVERMLAPISEEGHLPEFPFGSDLTEIEVGLMRGLRTFSRVKRPRPSNLPGMEALRAGWSVPNSAGPYLQRIGLGDPQTWKERLWQRAVAAGLVEAGVIDAE